MKEKNKLFDDIKLILMGKYPLNGPSTKERERDWENDKKILLPKIIDLYNFSKKDKDLEMIEWVYYFARRIRFYYKFEKIIPGIVEYYDSFALIQKEGIDYYLNPLKTEEHRIQSGQLYMTQYGIVMSGNIPRVGSSSCCSNCSEPISFGQAVCYCCKYPTIGPHGYPTFSILEWKDLSSETKIHYHKKAFEDMDKDIRGSRLKRAWNDPYKHLMPLYTAIGIYPTKMFGIVLD